ncbi:DUF6167 family protein [Nocardioides jiangxiensis]|uniref:DUF6167 family protein n=1 Tax=Nocardioides jiangxiensis TaxID=3064524 RepID=A0ABT9B188_9ACTN|nr:DUF6167 family protein [Nocardioides sp. WY-20]MDO7866913.1 DUF6167 family protein [Nocardioides sp. WY-20]
MSVVPGRAAMFVAGVGVGVYGMVKARRAQEALTPDGLRDRGRSLALGARMLRAEVEQARIDKEHELRGRLGLPPLETSRRTTELAPAGAQMKQIESRGQH